MPRFANVSTVPISLASGRVIEPGTQFDMDKLDPADDRPDFIIEVHEPSAADKKAAKDAADKAAKTEEKES